MAETGKSGGGGSGNSAKVTLDDIPKYWYPDRLADMREVGIGYPPSVSLTFPLLFYYVLICLHTKYIALFILFPRSTVSSPSFSYFLSLAFPLMFYSVFTLSAYPFSFFSTPLVFMAVVVLPLSLPSPISSLFFYFIILSTLVTLAIQPCHSFLPLFFFLISHLHT
jgi:hypothetical protein